jgi:hypothetical protein
MTCLAFAAADSAHGQPQPPAVTIKVTNKTDLTIVVRSYTVVNGAKRNPALFSLQKGEFGFDLKVPSGARLYSAININTGKALFQDQPVPVQARDLAISIVQFAPGLYKIVPDP